MPATAYLIGRQLPSHEAVPIGTPDLELASEGWDTLKEKLWLPHPYLIKRGSVRDAPGPEQGTFIVQDMRTMDWWAGCPVVEVISKGIAFADGKDYKLEASGATSEDLGLANVDTLSPTIWRLGYPRVTKLWVSLTTPAIYDHVRVASVPPDTFGIGSGPWSIAWVAPDNWVAAGWIGETRHLQQLPGSKACLVTDTWLYDPGNADRDGVRAGVIYL